MLILTTPDRDGIAGLRYPGEPLAVFHRRVELGQPVTNLLSKNDLEQILLSNGFTITSWKSVGPYLRWRILTITLSMAVSFLPPRSQDSFCKITGLPTKYQIVTAKKV